MTKKFIVYVLLLSALSFGCKKVNSDEIYEYKEIRTQYTERLTMTFPSIIGFNIPWIITIPTVGATFTEKYQSSNPYLHLVEDVKPVRIKVILIAPSNKDFSFVKNKKVYISTPTQPEILLGRVDNLPNNVGRTMYMIPQNVKLDKYMTDEMDMRIEIDADKSLLQEVQVAIELTVDARVKN
jgi:hypothetical protein